MLVVRVRAVGMLVRHGLVPVPMAVLTHEWGVVHMIMMAVVVPVGVLVLDGLVRMKMTVRLRRV